MRYVLVGALARDAVTSYVQGEEPTRATKDIDLAVRVDSMGHFRQATAGLQAIHGAEHKFLVAGLEVDLVPFSADEKSNSVEFEDAVLDTSGLREAEAEADIAIVDQDLQVRTASVGALCLLKVLAWRDRHAWTTKDAIDLKHLFDAVTHLPYENEAWGNDAVSELVDYDGSLIGAAWLGHEAGRIAHVPSRRAVLDVLETSRVEIASDMKGRLAAEQLDAFTRAFRIASAV